MDNFNLDDLSRVEQAILCRQFKQSQLAFTRFFFKIREQQKFIINQHHDLIAGILDRVIEGKLNRVIINIPPGYTKTEMVVINFIARGMAVNPRSKWIHTSYSESLALTNSQKVQEIVGSDEFQTLFPNPISKKSKGKSLWQTVLGANMLAVSHGGTMTGFRAGRMTDEFSGAIIIDDPLKPDDAISDVIRGKVNDRFNNTIKSRLAHEGVPIIVIMQRLHEDDPTGFLLKGGTGEKWHHLWIPAEIPEEFEYPDKYTHGIPIKHNLPPGPLWPAKHDQEQIEVLKNDPYTYASQYDQRPSPLGGGMFKDHWFQTYHETPVCDYRIIVADTAQKTKEVSDYSVFQLWGYRDHKIYLLDQLRGKWEAPDLLVQAEQFWQQHCGTGIQHTNALRAFYVEDMVSGTGLIQDLNRRGVPIADIQRNKDKVTRAMDVLQYISNGKVYLPASAPWLTEYRAEMSEFTAMMTHRHDDQVDPTVDAIQIMLAQSFEIRAGAL